jgi:hypothetical protein
MRMETDDLELLDWGVLSELGIIILTIGVWIMLHKRVARLGVIASVGLVIWWGVGRDPYVLAAAFLVGIVAVVVWWLVR